MIKSFIGLQIDQSNTRGNIIVFICTASFEIDWIPNRNAEKSLFCELISYRTFKKVSNLKSSLNYLFDHTTIRVSISGPVYFETSCTNDFFCIQ